MIARPIIVMFLAFLNYSMAVAADNTDRYEGRQHKQGDFVLPYRLLKPKDYDPKQKYPVVLFLHGGGERGTDNQKQLIHGLNDFAADDIMAKYPAFVVAPQCPEGKRWVEVDWSADSHVLPEQPSIPLAASLDLLDALAKEFSIDANRVYITGLSMGGYGVWDALAREPERFAAAAVICGGGDPAHAEKMKGIPIWAFHGDEDTTVKPHRSREMIAAIKAAGGQPKYTEYPTTGHHSWAQTYSNPELYEWLFSQKRK